MPPVPNVLAFVAASAVIFLLPGPSAFFAIGRTLALGRRGGLLSVLGNALGIIPAVTLVALGLGVLVSSSTAILLGVKIAGAAFLVYLGIQSVRHRHDGVGRSESAQPGNHMWRLIANGFVVGVTNPKAIVILVAILPQFVDPHGAPIPLQLATLGALSILIGGLCDTMWSLLAGTARTYFARSPRRLAIVRASGGAVMIGLGGGLAIDGAVEAAVQGN